MSYEQPRIISVNGRVIKISHLDVLTKPQTYLGAKASSSDTSLTVVNSGGFAEDDLIIVGKIGSENTEQVSITAAVSTVTGLTVDALSFTHPIGTPVRKVLFNQYKIYGNSSNTSVGATLLATVNIAFDESETQYVNTGTEYDYYFVLPYNSGSSASGSYSDGLAQSTGYPKNSVGSVISSVLASTMKKMNDKITIEWFLDEINECLDVISGELKRWSFLQNFDKIIGQTVMGTFSVSLPSDIDKEESFKSILSFHLSSKGDLTYVDKKEFDSLLENVARTEVRTEASASDTTLEVNNSYDFDDEGTVNVYIAGVKYSITYTGITRSATAGVLTGIPASGDGSITVTIPADTNIWQREQSGIPMYWTIYKKAGESFIYIWPLPDSSNDNFNMLLDYHTTRTLVDSMTDVFEIKRYAIIKSWLKWKIRGFDKSGGRLDENDVDYKLFLGYLRSLIRTEISGQKHKMKPKVNKIEYS